jgi:hypothetical protein
MPLRWVDIPTSRAERLPHQRLSGPCGKASGGSAPLRSNATPPPFSALTIGRRSFPEGLSVLCGCGKVQSNLLGTVVALAGYDKSSVLLGSSLKLVREPTLEVNPRFLTASAWEGCDERETDVRRIRADLSTHAGDIPLQACRWEERRERGKRWTRHEHDERGTGPGKPGTPAGGSNGLLGFWASHRDRAWL